MFLYPSLLPGKDGFAWLSKEYHAQILKWVILYKVIISIEHSRGFLANFLSVSRTASSKSKLCINLISKLIEKGCFWFIFGIKKCWSFVTFCMFCAEKRTGLLAFGMKNWNWHFLCNNNCSPFEYFTSNVWINNDLILNIFKFGSRKVHERNRQECFHCEKNPSL